MQEYSTKIATLQSLHHIGYMLPRFIITCKVNIWLGEGHTKGRPHPWSHQQQKEYIRNQIRMLNQTSQEVCVPLIVALEYLLCLLTQTLTPTAARLCPLQEESCVYL